MAEYSFYCRGCGQFMGNTADVKRKSAARHEHGTEEGYHIVDGKPCGPLAEIDFDMEELVEALNIKGLVTEYCCGGDVEKSAYITLDTTKIRNFQIMVDGGRVTLYWDRPLYEIEEWETDRGARHAFDVEAQIRAEDQFYDDKVSGKMSLPMDRMRLIQHGEVPTHRCLECTTFLTEAEIDDHCCGTESVEALTPEIEKLIENENTLGEIREREAAKKKQVAMDAYHKQFMKTSRHSKAGV